MNKLLSELKQIVTEFGFTHRWSKIEMYHSIGRVLNKGEIRLSQIPEIANFLNVEENDLWDAIIFYKTYPDLDLFPMGKNASWKKVKELLE